MIGDCGDELNELYFLGNNEAATFKDEEEA